MSSRILFLFCFFISVTLKAQNYPWERPLKIAWSPDGVVFSNTVIFQDSSGVPSAIRWKGDTLICVFQWFREPIGSITWDKVAVKFSYDARLTWTIPVPVSINNYPTAFQRPFDPTITLVNNDSVRLYYSASDGIPSMGNDSIINTYSASSNDGINFTFEPGARFDHSSNRVIDPAVIHFNNSWNYAAPIGAPQAGAYHCNGSDGIHFLQQADYLSDILHNWTGNFMINDSNDLRFYGSGQWIWYNSSPDAFSWSGYVNTNLHGGDPTVIRLTDSAYIAIFVGEPYTTSIDEISNDKIEIYPNPYTDHIYINGNSDVEFYYEVFTCDGIKISSGKSKINLRIELPHISRSELLLRIYSSDTIRQYKLINIQNKN
jgi:hypothetical protein